MSSLPICEGTSQFQGSRVRLLLVGTARFSGILGGRDPRRPQVKPNESSFGRERREEAKKKQQRKYSSTPTGGIAAAIASRLARLGTHSVSSSLPSTSFGASLDGSACRKVGGEIGDQHKKRVRNRNSNFTTLTLSPGTLLPEYYCTVASRRSFPQFERTNNGNLQSKKKIWSRF